MSNVSGLLDRAITEFLSTVASVQTQLEELRNAEQLTSTQFDEHVSGDLGRHGIDSIIYENNTTLREYLSKLVLNSGSGTMDHSLLENRSAADAHPISAITGLSGALGHVYTYLGSTSDTTETELFTEASADSYINSDGRLTLPGALTDAAIINISIAAITHNSVPRVLSFSMAEYAGFISTSFAVEGYAQLQSVASQSWGFGGQQSRISAVSLEADVLVGISSFALKVTSAVEETVKWKAVVRLIPVLLSEFE